jgi:prepilin-type N-terminal cleavage/methylation domain-containing protein
MMMKSQGRTDAGAGPGRGKPRSYQPARGFSLVELIVAMAVFLIVAAASFTLFSRHETLLSQEQGVAGLNIGLRNALAQIQMDVVNAGYGLLLGANVPAWPVGVTIVNSNPTTSQCNPSPTNPVYTSYCFDTLNIVMVDQNTPAVQPTNSCTTSPLNTSTATSVTASPAAGYYAQSFYSNFVTGDQILFVKSNGTQFTTALLTANGTCPGCTSTTGSVVLTFNSTGAGGTNTAANDPISMTTGSVVSTNGTTVTWGSGPYFVTNGTWNGQSVQINGTSYTVSSVASTTSLTLTATAGSQTSVPFFYGASLTNSFCSTDWVLRLLPIQFSVSVANASDPQLVRTQAKVTNVVMDQVIGFKVGAAFWNNTTSTFQYDYLASDYGNNFTLVRAIRVSLIGRTPPSTDPTYTYRNPFDNGRYQIRGTSIIVNPRNLTMNND